MSLCVLRRVGAGILAIFLLVSLAISPAAELYGEHDHSCSANSCLVCLCANALSRLLTDVYAVLCATFFILIIYILLNRAAVADITLPSTPVELKTKITS